MKLIWNKILNECVYQLANHQDFANIYTKIGVPPRAWPECTARDLAMELYEKKDSTSLRAAMIDIAPATENLQREEIHYTASMAIEQINKAINFGNGLQLANRIMQDPSGYGDTIKNLEAITHSDTSVDIRSAMEIVFKQRLKALESSENVNRTISGYPLLSSLIGGFNDSRITLLVAGSGVGKTTFALNLIISAIKDFPCLYLNMEMSLEDMIMRLVCVSQGVQQSYVDNNSKHLDRVFANTHSYFINNNNLFMTPGANMTMEQIASSIYKRASEGAKLIVIDYDQKIKMGMLDQEWKEILLAVEGLEDIAKRTKTHIIILAQGDENNLPKASKRSMQPCSSVLAFYEDEGKYYMESKKNRFGKKFKMLMDCDFSTYKISEKHEVNLKKNNW